MSAGDTIFPFGKHKNKPLREIPIGYLDWALGLVDLRGSLREQIEAYLATQAEYNQDETADWREGREDYIDD